MKATHNIKAKLLRERLPFKYQLTTILYTFTKLCYGTITHNVLNVLTFNDVVSMLKRCRFPFGYIRVKDFVVRDQARQKKTIWVVFYFVNAKLLKRSPSQRMF